MTQVFFFERCRASKHLRKFRIFGVQETRKTSSIGNKAEDTTKATNLVPWKCEVTVVGDSPQVVALVVDTHGLCLLHPKP